MKDQLNKHIIHFTLRHFIVYCLVTSVLFKPISIMFVHLNDIKVEIFVDFGENTSNENDLNTDFESEDRLFYSNRFNLITQIKETFQDFYSHNENLLNYNPNIQLPPPKI